MVTAGDVALLWFPFSNEESGKFKKRPVLVLNREGFGDDQAVSCVMITGSEARVARPHAGDIPIPDWQRYGLARESVIRPARFWSAEDRDVYRVIGTADAAFTDRVRAEVARIMGVRAT